MLDNNKTNGKISGVSCVFIGKIRSEHEGV